MWCGNVRRAVGGGGSAGEGGQTVRRRHEAVEVARVTENTKRCDRRVVSARFVDSLRAFPPREEVVRMLRHVWPARLVASTLRAIEWPTPILFAALTRGSCVSPFLLRLLHVLLVIRASFQPFLGSFNIYRLRSFVFRRANSFSIREFEFSDHTVSGVSEFFNQTRSIHSNGSKSERNTRLSSTYPRILHVFVRKLCEEKMAPWNLTMKFLADIILFRAVNYSNG